tara:strand:+ start:55 stop:414 length:360 start_codon:yes stop_codon:yes gene_type:complete
MFMSTKCPECGEKFTARKALCDDWNDPNKSFGCPHCGVFFVRKSSPKDRTDLKNGIISGGIMVPASMLIGRYFVNGDILDLFYGVVIFSSCIAIQKIDSVQFGRALVRSAHNKKINDRQ